MTRLLRESLCRAGLAPDLPFTQILGIRQDRSSFLVYAPDGRDRVAHVKVATSEAGRASLATEYAALDRLARVPDLAGTVPAPRAWYEADGMAASVVSGVSGRRLDAVLARRRARSRTARAYVDRVVTWLDVVHAGTRTGTTTIDPCAAFDSLRMAGLGRSTLERVRGLLGEYAQIRLPRVIAHGDLWPGNMLVDRAGDVSVVDWETARIDGDPFDDLLFFLLTFVRATLPGNASLGDAAHVSLVDGTSWRSALVRSQMRRLLDRDGLPRELAPVLMLLFLARRVLGNAERVRRGTPSSSEWPDVLARYVAAERSPLVVPAREAIR